MIRGINARCVCVDGISRGMKVAAWKRALAGDTWYGMAGAIQCPQNWQEQVNCCGQSAMKDKREK